MVFFTVTRSFYLIYGTSTGTIILKILLFVVCVMIFLLRVMSVYVRYCEYSTIFDKYELYTTVPYLWYFLIKNIDDIKGMARNRMKKTLRYRTVNLIKTKIVKKSVFEFSLFYFSQSLRYFSI